MAHDNMLIDVDYPDSDGEPMGETDLHREWMIRIIDALIHRYRDDPMTYATGNLLMYYVEGDPRCHMAPDALVVKDCPNHPRDIFKLWEEPHAPCFVVEITSKTTRKRDEFIKPRIYANIGINEYFLFDPRSDYLDPPLQGHRLDGTDYVRIEPDARGRLTSEEIGITLRLDEDGELVMEDRVTGERLLTEGEAIHAEYTAAEERRREAEERQSQAERERDAERAAREAAEAELAQLRRQLGKDSPDAPE